MINPWLKKIRRLIFHRWTGPYKDFRQPLRQNFRVGFMDLDENFHMNNNAFGRYMELGRWETMLRSGFFAYAVKNRVFAPVANQYYLYTREMRLFQRFTLVTRVVSLNEKSIFFQHEIFRGEQRCGLSLTEIRVVQKKGAGTLLDIAAELGITAPDKNTHSDRSCELLRQLTKHLLFV